MASDDTSRLFGRYHEIVLLVVGFLLTGLVGGLLTNLYQTRSWKIQHDIQLDEARRHAAEAALESVASLMDKRIQLAWRVLGEPNLGRLEKGDRSKYRLEYETILDDWHFNFNSVLAKLRVYFGEDAAQFYEYVVVADLHALEADMQQASPSVADLTRMRKQLSIINDHVYWFNIYLLENLEGRNSTVNLKTVAGAEFRRHASMR